MPRQTPSRTSSAARPADSHVLKFVSRVEQLELRGRRNFDRYMRVIKKYVAADSPERVQWQRESAEESERDAAWNRSHGPVPGGASILPWRDERDKHDTGLRGEKASEGNATADDVTGRGEAPTTDPALARTDDRSLPSPAV